MVVTENKTVNASALKNDQKGKALESKMNSEIMSSRITDQLIISNFIRM